VIFQSPSLFPGSQRSLGGYIYGYGRSACEYKPSSITTCFRGSPLMKREPHISSLLKGHERRDGCKSLRFCVAAFLPRCSNSSRALTRIIETIQTVGIANCMSGCLFGFTGSYSKSLRFRVSSLLQTAPTPIETMQYSARQFSRTALAATVAGLGYSS